MKVTHYTQDDEPTPTREIDDGDVRVELAELAHTIGVEKVVVYFTAGGRTEYQRSE